MKYNHQISSIFFFLIAIPLAADNKSITMSMKI